MAQVRTCPTSQLAVSVRPLGQAGLGHAGQIILFENRGASCVLDGYPGVDALAHGRAVVHVPRTSRGYLGGASPQRIVLTTGRSASALLEGLQAPAPGRACPDYSQLAVTPPNDRVSVTLTSSQRLCDLQVHAVAPGTAGGRS